MWGGERETEGTVKYENSSHLLTRQMDMRVEKSVEMSWYYVVMHSVVLHMF